MFLAEVDFWNLKNHVFYIKFVEANLLFRSLFSNSGISKFFDRVRLWVVDLGGVALSGTSGWHFEVDSCFRERSGGLDLACILRLDKGWVDLDS